MSIKIMSYIWEHSPHAGSDLVMLLALADHANDQGLAWPSLPTLARKCRVEKRQAIYILRKLEKAGSISVTHGQGRGHVSIYTVKGAPTCTIPEEKVQLSAPIPEEKVQLSAPIPEEKVHSRVRKGALECTQTVREPEEEENQDPPSPPSEGVSPAGKQRGSRSVKRHRCPPDYQPGDGVRAWAASHAPGVDVDEALDAMRDYEFHTPRSDWDATLRNWIRREGKQTPARAYAAATFRSRAAWRDQFNVSTTLQLEEMLNGAPGHEAVWPESRPARRRVPHRIDAPHEAGVLDRPERPAP